MVGALFTETGEGHVMTIELKTGSESQFTAESIKQLIGHFVGDVALFAGDVTVVAAGQVVAGCEVAGVGVFDQTELFEFFEDAVDGRGRDVVDEALYGSRDHVGREVVAGLHEDSNDRTLRLGDSFTFGPQSGEHFVNG